MAAKVVIAALILTAAVFLLEGWKEAKRIIGEIREMDKRKHR